MIAALALSLILQSPKLPVIEKELPSLFWKNSRTLFISYAGAIQSPKLSPLKYGTPSKQHEFKFLTAGFAIPKAGATQFDLRFRVYSQSLSDNLHYGIPVATELLRLWEMDAHWLKIDHSQLYHDQIVDVYLANGGTPGGQQMFGIDHENGVEFKSNMIYIYDLSSFNDPLEECREVAHEYGHAVLPAVGGYSKPEYWANGYLGEKLYLRWLDEELRAGKVTKDDTMGATRQDLDSWVNVNINSIEKSAAEKGPHNLALKGTNAHAMAAFHGLVCYCDSIMPHKMFGRSLLLIGGEKAVDYLSGAVLASEESSWKPNFPPFLAGRLVWVPVGTKGTVIGTKVIAKSQGWDKVIAKFGMEIHQPPVSN